MEAVKTIIITGGGGHLGRSVARWWAKPGTHLVLIDRDADRLDKSRAHVTEQGADLTTIVADVTVPDALKTTAASLPDAATMRATRISTLLSAPNCHAPMKSDSVTPKRAARSTKLQVSNSSARRRSCAGDFSFAGV